MLRYSSSNCAPVYRHSTSEVNVVLSIGDEKDKFQTISNHISDTLDYVEVRYGQQICVSLDIPLKLLKIDTSTDKWTKSSCSFNSVSYYVFRVNIKLS